MSSDGITSTDPLELPERGLDDLEPFELPELSLQDLERYFQEATFPSVEIIYLEESVDQEQGNKYLVASHDDDESDEQKGDQEQGNKYLVTSHDDESDEQKGEQEQGNKYFVTNYNDDESGEQEGERNVVHPDDTSNEEVAENRDELPDEMEARSNLSQSSELFQQFDKIRKEVDRRLATVTKFLPQDLLGEFNERFDSAARKANPLAFTDTEQAILALEQLQMDLDKAAAPTAGLEAQALRAEIGKRLSVDGKLLETDQRKQFAERLETLIVDNHPQPEQQVVELRKLDDDVEKAIETQIKAISDLMVDFEQLQPSIVRALKIYEVGRLTDRKASLELRCDQLAKGQVEGLDALRNLLSELRNEVGELLKSIPLEEKRKLQSESMPVLPTALKKGSELGRGAFGEVVRLAGSDDVPLVGKCFDPSEENGLNEMKHEEDIYARVGEHPNIAKCFGIQQIDGQEMLVMQEIEGSDINKVFGKLEKDFRDKKIGREDYLGGLQHLFKGTLQGLAQFESLGLVHKDVKGDNIRFDKHTNQPVLVDMGLAQDVSNKHENIKTFVPNAPPEQFVTKATENRISNLWDSFTVGKMLFPLMEQDPNSTQKYQFVPGMDGPQKAELNRYGSVDPTGMGPASFIAPSNKTLKRDEKGNYTATTDKDGNILGSALKPAKGSGQVKPGEYGVESQYVDFMSRLTHPDPKQRMSPLEALKHPFMTQSLVDEKHLSKLFSTETPPEQPSDPGSNQPPPTQQEEVVYTDELVDDGKQEGKDKYFQQGENEGGEDEKYAATDQEKYLAEGYADEKQDD